MKLQYSYCILLVSAFMAVHSEIRAINIKVNNTTDVGIYGYIIPHDVALSSKQAKFGLINKKTELTTTFDGCIATIIVEAWEGSQAIKRITALIPKRRCDDFNLTIKDISGKLVLIEE